MTDNDEDALVLVLVRDDVDDGEIGESESWLNEPGSGTLPSSGLRPMVDDSLDLESFLVFFFDRSGSWLWSTKT